MTIDEFKALAPSMNEALNVLIKKRLYVTAFFYPQDGIYPDRILVQGIKNLRTTGRFTVLDINAIEDVIHSFTGKSTVFKRLNADDQCMYEMCITLV